MTNANEEDRNASYAYTVRLPSEPQRRKSSQRSANGCPEAGAASCSERVELFYTVYKGTQGQWDSKRTYSFVQVTVRYGGVLIDYWHVKCLLYPWRVTVSVGRKISSEPLAKRTSQSLSGETSKKTAHQQVSNTLKDS